MTVCGYQGLGLVLFVWSEVVKTKFHLGSRWYQTANLEEQSLEADQVQVERKVMSLCFFKPL